ncbi:hypothetical protein N7481_010354 [Penicillium waksmanii]|uniref:uncharacterized protein n=1 Tax=Penicillium waksmanii TaxID=69791 RepID=UPI002546C9D2|nr:uncharacterized protein N7481_010354 [Penicillium waksmanii]KAJ5976647.1 hypothetical protein N7481_010354 [Penicillium waksmanii]
MEKNELNIKLKGALDMTVFSQLLEMDEEEDRKSSSTALYGFIERGKEKVDYMEIALESLQQSAVVLGFRKFHKSCENIRQVGATMSIHGEVTEAIEMFRLSLIKKEIGNLNDSLRSARTAINSFYMDTS